MLVDTSENEAWLVETDACPALSTTQRLMAKLIADALQNEEIREAPVCLRLLSNSWFSGLLASFSMNGRLLLASMLFDSSSSADPSSNAEHPSSDSSSLYIAPQAHLTDLQEIPKTTP
ncbi:unnamed protein product [Pleuronectes platessa]|uniref:Uncharacterized protein n=1 Tax=Pleuronectes platessa TaxID=8262 RepID=A0A9N7UXH8_PLEPL|nr:unnamed protein product [Pleuronectes platessa]